MASDSDDDNVSHEFDQEEKKSCNEEEDDVIEVDQEKMEEEKSNDDDDDNHDGGNGDDSIVASQKKSNNDEDDDEPSENNNNDDHGSSDDDSSSEEEEDESSFSEEEDEDESSDEDEDDDDDDDENEKDQAKENNPASSAVPVVSEDGHVLSEYEMMRLERIKRNREHLERLGLAKKNSSNDTGTSKSTTLLGPLLEQQKKDNNRSKNKKSNSHVIVPPEQRRSSSRARKSISYKEQPLRAVLGPDALLPLSSSKGKNKSSSSGSTGGKTSQSTLNKRMDLQIYREFKRIGTQRKENIRIGKQLVRKAETEFKHAQKKAIKFEKQERNRLEIERFMKDIAREKEHIGCTIREMLDHLDKRKYVMMSAKQHYEQTQKAKKEEVNMKHFREEAELKMQMIDALDRFPLAIKEAQNTLDMLLVERLPEDPPLPRTSGRKRKRGSSARPSASVLSSPSSSQKLPQDTQNKVNKNSDEPQQTQETENSQKIQQQQETQEEELHQENSKPSSEDRHTDAPTTALEKATTTKSTSPDDDETPEITTKKNVPFQISFDARGKPLKIRVRAGMSLLTEAKAKALKESSDGVETSTQISEAGAKSVDEKSKDAAVATTDAAQSSQKTSGSSRSKKEFPIRNVGGWISPDFEKSIDRSWLERDAIPSVFDPKTFVPQVGDVVLYYPAGHQQFLEAHPDVMGNRSKNKTMLPLWVRAQKERSKLRADKKNKEKEQQQYQEERTNDTNGKADKKQEPQLPSESQSLPSDNGKTKHWWTDEWLSAIHGDLGRWPLVCRVEKTHAEFPQDPNRDQKVVIKEEGVVQITWKVPEENEDKTDSSGKESKTKKGTIKDKTKKTPKKKENTAKSNTNGKIKKKSKEKAKKSSVEKKTKKKAKEVSKPKRDSNNDKWRKELTKKPKKKKSRKPHLCLVVQLRPLTGLTPPDWQTNDDGDESSSSKSLSNPHLPPSFNIVTFPSKTGPFLLPFSWAYRISQSFSVGDAVQPRSEKKNSGTIAGFPTQKVCGSPLLSDRLDDLTTLFGDIFSEQKPLLSFLQKVFTQQQKFFLPDMYGVALVMMRCLQDNDRVGSLVTLAENKSELQQLQGGLLLEKRVRDIILNTLPIWKGISVKTEEGKFKNNAKYSCWDLVEPEKADITATMEEGPPSFLQAFSELQGMVRSVDGPVTSLEEALRAKIECTLDKYIEERPDCDPFYYPVRAKDHPTYFCAIPLGMWLGRIYKRLRVAPGSNQECYYRSIDALLSDLQDIGCNCALYNSPDSEIMKDALAVLPGLKAEVWRVASSHQREMETRRRVDEERRKLVLLQCSANKKDGEENINGNKKKRKEMDDSPFFGPFREPLNRNWITAIEADRSWALLNSESKEEKSSYIPESFEWVPQCGDVIFYNRTFHEKFIKSHYQSLRIDQCKLPDLANDTSPFGVNPDKEWKRGNVVWVRAAFPGLGSIAEGEGNLCFDIATPLLSVGIHLEAACSSNPVHEIFWRPCSIESRKERALVAIPSTRTRGCSKKSTEAMQSPLLACPCCAVDLRTSFLMPSWFRCQNEIIGSNDTSASLEIPLGIEPSLALSIDRCFNMLKRRCLCEIPSDYVDPKFCLENVKQGVYPVSSGKSKLPSYEAFFECGAENVTEGIIPRTRGRQSTRESSVKLLAESCFLPSWTSDDVQSDSDDGGSSKIVKHELFSPNPKLCLEMIQLRLQKGFYRSTAALVHDIQEAYVSSMILAFMIARKTNQKGKSAISLKKLARSYLLENDKMEKEKSSNLSRLTSPPKGKTKKGNNKIITKATKKKTKIKLKPEERAYKAVMSEVRKLYATALACVLDTRVFEKVFGLSRKPKLPQNVSDAPKDLSEEEKEMRFINEKIAVILKSLGRDPCNDRLRAPNSAQLLPQITIKVRCNGRVVKPLKNSSEAAFQTDQIINTAVAASDLDADCLTKLSITEYDSNLPLSRVLFGRQNKMNPCGRCVALRRNLPYCRIVKNHANPDFDWIDFFQGAPKFRGTTGVDEMILRLHPESQLKLLVNPVILAPVNSDVSKNSTNSEPVPESTATPSPPTVSNMTEESISGETRPSPADILALAKSALLMARSRLEAATAEFQKPIRMSDEFIQSYFRVDEDGHYYFCYVCGLIGDVICCESCPNVAHPTCANLSAVPEGDWFCEKCTAKKESVENEGEGSDDEYSATCQLIGDSEAEHGTGKTLEEILEDLRSTREKPSQKEESCVKAAQVSSDNDPKSNIEIGSLLVKEFGKLGKFKGTVIQLPAEEGHYYRVRYEDGDEEDMSVGELQPLIHLDQDSVENELQESKTMKDAPKKKIKESRAKPSKSTAKNQSSTKLAPKRGRGRPRKIKFDDASEHEQSVRPNSSTKKPLGRPRKIKSDDASEHGQSVKPNSSTKKPRGRPRKRLIEDISHTRNASNTEEASQNQKSTAKRSRINGSHIKKPISQHKNTSTQTRKVKVQKSRERGPEMIQSPSRYGRNRKQTNRLVDHM